MPFFGDDREEIINETHELKFKIRQATKLMDVWEEEPQPIKQALKEIRAEETKAIKFVPGYAGAWRARRIQTVNQWRKEK